ncbi:MAG: aspartyl protease family protein [Saprospiraceae bacterium]
MTKYSMLIGIFLALFSNKVAAQVFDLAQHRTFTKEEVPFRFEGNFILVSVLFNNLLPLTFILDTGAEYSILTKKEIADFLNIDYQKRYTLYGADMQEELYAYLSKNISLQMGDLQATHRSILVLEEDYFRFEEYSGLQIHGILGADFLKRFTLQIDYQKQMITFFSPAYFKNKVKINKDNVDILPFTLIKSKPYIRCTTHLYGEEINTLNYLIDTGAGLSLLLYTSIDSLKNAQVKMLNSPIGLGLGGKLEGYVGRIKSFQFASKSFPELITKFQQKPVFFDSLMITPRDGIIGNNILSAFSKVIFDYNTSKMIVSKSPKNIKQRPYDRSGLIIGASGDNLNIFTILRIIENTPAFKSGLQIGDKINKINGLSTGILSLDMINNKFSGSIGKKMRLTIQRDNQFLEFELQLEDII